MPDRDKALREAVERAVSKIMAATCVMDEFNTPEVRREWAQIIEGRITPLLDAAREHDCGDWFEDGVRCDACKAKLDGMLDPLPPRREGTHGEGGGAGGAAASGGMSSDGV